MRAAKLLLILVLLLPMGAWAAEIFYYKGHRFVHHPAQGLIYAERYDRSTINALVDFCNRNGIRTYYMVPRGYVGAIPNHLHRYTYKQFYRSHIQVHPYRAYHYRPFYHDRYYPYQERRSGIIFHFRF